MKPLKRSDDIISNINITPFTDVILVLLIIFMISAPSIFLTSIEIRLPRGENQSSNNQYNEILGIDKNGNIYYKNKLISKEDLKNLFPLQKEKESKTILINADIDAKHGDVIEIIQILRNLNYSNVYVGTSK